MTNDRDRFVLSGGLYGSGQFLVARGLAQRIDSLTPLKWKHLKGCAARAHTPTQTATAIYPLTARIRGVPLNYGGVLR
jgi:hypothetical protein